MLPEGCGVVPVLSNLAVSRSARGSGLGKALCTSVEELARDAWDFGAVLLQVEAENEPACNLYSGLGYVEMWRDESASARISTLIGPATRGPA